MSIELEELENMFDKQMKLQREIHSDTDGLQEKKEEEQESSSKKEYTTIHYR